MLLLPIIPLIFSLQGLLTAVTATDCYGYGGNILKNLWPCNPDRVVSNCCSYNDFCLDNGLCLDAGADNFYTQQGCTDPDFAGPCNYLCATDGSDGAAEGDYHMLWLCNPTRGVYCCGADSSCCFNSSSIQLTLDVYTTVTRAPSATSAAGTTAAAAATTNMMTTTALGTVTITAPAKTITAAAESVESAVSAAKKDARLTAGLGAGLASAAVALAAGYFWGRHAALKRMKPAGDGAESAVHTRNSNVNAEVPKQAVVYQSPQYLNAQELPERSGI